jgi:hypothetical protein
MKFIDSEYLKRILQRVVEHLKEKGADKEVRVIESVIKFLKVMERFHSVDVVRCEECTHHNPKKALRLGGIWCEYWGTDPDPEDWCCKGERRTDDST